MICLNYFSITMTKHHGQGSSLQKEVFNCISRTLDFLPRNKGMAAETVENSHFKQVEKRNSRNGTFFLK